MLAGNLSEVVARCGVRLEGRGYLNASFTQVQAECEFFSCEDVGILCLLERTLQLMQLEGREGRPASTDFARLVSSFLLVVTRRLLIVIRLLAMQVLT